MPVEQKNYKATLKNGEVYVFGEKVANRDKPIKVTEAEKDHLEEHAVDTYAVGKSGDNHVRQKFEFEELADGEDVDSADQGATSGKAKSATGAVRSRTRT